MDEPKCVESVEITRQRNATSHQAAPLRTTNSAFIGIAAGRHCGCTQRVAGGESRPVRRAKRRTVYGKAKFMAMQFETEPFVEDKFQLVLWITSVERTELSKFAAEHEQLGVGRCANPQIAHTNQRKLFAFLDLACQRNQPFEHIATIVRRVGCFLQ